LRGVGPEGVALMAEGVALMLAMSATPSGPEFFAGTDIHWAQIHKIQKARTHV
jgi:hypothetical protein